MKGIIYKITCNETGEVYIGSTRRQLSLRMTEHKSDFKRYTLGNKDFMTSFRIIERGNYSYSLIETVECENTKQLEARERYYIETHECVNKIIIGRTDKEYREANKDNISRIKEVYYEANKDSIKEYQKQWHRDYRNANKEKINALRRERYLQKNLLK